MRFYSTNRDVAPTGLREALFQGQAADRGLYMPETYPSFGPDELEALGDKTYPEIASAILRPFTKDVIDEGRLLALCEDAYDYEVPIEKVTDRRHVLRLDQGPTASFKDFAARMMARWMGELLAEDEQELVILTATSGDTGSAVAHAYHGIDGIRIVVLFPKDEVSTRQRKQMTTLGGNVTTFSVDGKFDDCQALVKRAFADEDLAGIRLSSANSINIGRLLPQSVYYVYAYVRLADAANLEPIVFSVPSGNFGDMMGAVIARKMGVPIERLVIATNENDEVPKFLASGVYQKIEPSRVCISNAMNVGHPSNLARLVDLYGGWMDEKGTLRASPSMEKLRADLFGISITDAETRETIKQAYENHGVILEPHGAVGWAGLQRFVESHSEASSRTMVSVETAHPAKFPEEIRSLIGIDPEVPLSLSGIEDRPETFEPLTVDYEPFRDMLRARFS